jgi:hypothetical protein
LYIKLIQAGERKSKTIQDALRKYFDESDNKTGQNHALNESPYRIRKEDMSILTTFIFLNTV